MADRINGHLREINTALQIPERAPNDQRLPGYSLIRHGALLRCDGPAAEAAGSYFCLDEITTPTEPTKIRLGAECHLVYAYATDPAEPLRAIIADSDWAIHMAEKKLQRWLQGLRNRKEVCAK